MTIRFPHGRGGVPYLVRLYQDGKLFSPRAWGCSGVDVHRRSDDVVFPTGVGVFRCQVDRKLLTCAFRLLGSI